jgi:hypothetical protein
MPNATRHQQIEEEFRGMLAAAGLPQPEEVAHMRRALVFLWYETKAFVLVDLAELSRCHRCGAARGIRRHSVIRPAAGLFSVCT